MTTVKLSDEALFAFFQSHPGFLDRVASIASAVGNLDGDLAEADAAEERLVEGMRLLGRAALQGWADERVVATEQEIRQQPGMHGNGKKTLLAYEIRRDRGPSSLSELISESSVGQWLTALCGHFTHDQVGVDFGKFGGAMVDGIVWSPTHDRRAEDVPKSFGRCTDDRELLSKARNRRDKA